MPDILNINGCGDKEIVGSGQTIPLPMNNLHVKGIFT
jgi:hypothetical protein